MPEATFTRQLGRHPGLQTPSESRTLAPESGISNVWLLIFREEYLLISLKTQHSWEGKCEGRGAQEKMTEMSLEGNTGELRVGFWRESL